MKEAVLRHLTSAGVRHNILMMDAEQASRSINNHPPYLAGRFYTLIPMKSSMAFHPKVILLAGKNKGALLVGSHNMTLSGFGYNRELTNLVRVSSLGDNESIGVLQSAWQQIMQWVNSQSANLPQHVIEMVAKTTDFAAWLRGQSTEKNENCAFISSQAGEPSLWTQLKSHIGGEVRKVIVTGAFFDSNLDFIRRIDDELKPKEFVVGADPETVQMPTDFVPKGVKFTNCTGIRAGEKDKAGYLHAKAIVVETEDGNTILAHLPQLEGVN